MAPMVLSKLRWIQAEQRLEGRVKLAMAAARCGPGLAKWSYDYVMEQKARCSRALQEYAQAVLLWRRP